MSILQVPVKTPRLRFIQGSTCMPIHALLVKANETINPSIVQVLIKRLAVHVVKHVTALTISSELVSVLRHAFHLNHVHVLVTVVFIVQVLLNLVRKNSRRVRSEQQSTALLQVVHAAQLIVLRELIDFKLLGVIPHLDRLVVATG